MLGFNAITTLPVCSVPISIFSVYSDTQFVWKILQNINKENEYNWHIIQNIFNDAEFVWKVFKKIRSPINVNLDSFIANISKQPLKTQSKISPKLNISK